MTSREIACLVIGVLVGGVLVYVLDWVRAWWYDAAGRAAYWADRITRVVGAVALVGGVLTVLWFVVLKKPS